MEYTDRDLETMFDEMLDECHPTITIGSLYYNVSDVLKSVDPVAYRQEFLNYLDCLIGDRIVFEHTDGSYHDTAENEANESLTAEFE